MLPCNKIFPVIDSTHQPVWLSTIELNSCFSKPKKKNENAAMSEFLSSELWPNGQNSAAQCSEDPILWLPCPPPPPAPTLLLEAKGHLMRWVNF